MQKTKKVEGTQSYKGGHPKTTSLNTKSMLCEASDVVYECPQAKKTIGKHANEGNRKIEVIVHQCKVDFGVSP